MGIELPLGGPFDFSFYRIPFCTHFHYFLCPFLLRFDSFSYVNCINMPTSFSRALATFSFHSEWILIFLFRLYFCSIRFFSRIVFYCAILNIGFIFMLFVASFSPTQISLLFILGTLIVCQSSFILFGALSLFRIVWRRSTLPMSRYRLLFP